MNIKEQNKNNNISKNEVRNIFKKMLSDKKSISSYIQKNGTLDGFNDDTIILAKPL